MNIDKYTPHSFLPHFVIITSLLLSGGCTTITDITPLSSDKKLRPTPIVFVNGLSISEGEACNDMKSGDWSELYDLFDAHGYKLSVACTAQNGSLDKIAEELHEWIKNNYPNSEKFHVIAKSLGGLAVRRALTIYKNDLANKIVSITTISTPHKGSIIADFLVNKKKLDGDGCMATQIGIDLNKSLSLFGNKDFRESGQELTLKKMEEFNIKNPRDPRIPFFSFGYKIDCSTASCKLFDHILPVYPTYSILECFHNTIALHGSTYDNKVNDGLVTPDSANYGDYLGTFEGDHFSQTTNSRYKYRSIWKDVFEKVIVNLKRLDKQKHQ